MTTPDLPPISAMKTFIEKAAADTREEDAPPAERLAAWRVMVKTTLHQMETTERQVTKAKALLRTGWFVLAAATAMAGLTTYNLVAHIGCRAP